MTVRSIHGVCDLCGSQTCIHLVVQKHNKTELIHLFCAGCMEKKGIPAGSAVIELTSPIPAEDQAAIFSRSLGR
jgi:hypothetical protein